MAEWMDELERLAELRDRGLLTDEEFEVKRQEIVNISSRIIKEEMKTSEVINPNGDNHDYGVHDYDVLFPNGEYRDDYDLLELQAMSVEDLDELSNWLKSAGYVQATNDPNTIHVYLKELKKRIQQVDIDFTHSEGESQEVEETPEPLKEEIETTQAKTQKALERLKASSSPDLEMLQRIEKIWPNLIASTMPNQLQNILSKSKIVEFRNGKLLVSIEEGTVTAIQSQKLQQWAIHLETELKNKIGRSNSNLAVQFVTEDGSPLEFGALQQIKKALPNLIARTAPNELTHRLKGYEVVSFDNGWLVLDVDYSSITKMHQNLFDNYAVNLAKMLKNEIDYTGHLFIYFGPKGWRRTPRSMHETRTKEKISPRTPKAPEIDLEPASKPPAPKQSVNTAQYKRPKLVWAFLIIGLITGASVVNRNYPDGFEGQGVAAFIDFGLYPILFFGISELIARSVWKSKNK